MTMKLLDVILSQFPNESNGSNLHANLYLGKLSLHDIQCLALSEGVPFDDVLWAYGITLRPGTQGEVAGHTIKRDESGQPYKYEVVSSDKISPSEPISREEIRDSSLVDALIKSIEDNGSSRTIEPITINPIGKILDGHHRFAAMMSTGQSEFPVWRQLLGPQSIKLSEVESPGLSRAEIARLSRENGKYYHDKDLVSPYSKHEKIGGHELEFRLMGVARSADESHNFPEHGEFSVHVLDHNNIDSHVIGYIRGAVHPNTMQIEESYLAKPYQGKGVGRRMYEHAIGAAHKVGRKHLASDYTVSDKAGRVWRRLKAIGYNVEGGPTQGYGLLDGVDRDSADTDNEMMGRNYSVSTEPTKSLLLSESPLTDNIFDEEHFHGVGPDKGDWIRGDDGKPKQFYHGTLHDFDSFDHAMARGGDMFERKLGTHISEDPAIANSFTKDRVMGSTHEKDTLPNARILPVKVWARNVYDVPQPIVNQFKSGPQYQGDSSAIWDDAMRKVLDSGTSEAKQLWIDLHDNSNDGYSGEDLGAAYDAHMAGKPYLYTSKFGFQPNRTQADILKGEKTWSGAPDTITPAHILLGNVNSGMYGPTVLTKLKIAKAYIRHLQQNGYDALRYVNTAPMETLESKDNHSHIVFDPRRIKGYFNQAPDMLDKRLMFSDPPATQAEGDNLSSKWIDSMQEEAENAARAYIAKKHDEYRDNGGYEGYLDENGWGGWLLPSGTFWHNSEDSGYGNHQDQVEYVTGIEDHPNPISYGLNKLGWVRVGIHGPNPLFQTGRIEPTKAQWNWLNTNVPPNAQWERFTKGMKGANGEEVDPYEDRRFNYMKLSEGGVRDIRPLDDYVSKWGDRTQSIAESMPTKDVPWGWILPSGKLLPAIAEHSEVAKGVMQEATGNPNGWYTDRFSPVDVATHGLGWLRLQGSHLQAGRAKPTEAQLEFVRNKTPEDLSWEVSTDAVKPYGDGYKSGEGKDSFLNFMSGKPEGSQLKRFLSEEDLDSAWHDGVKRWHLDSHPITKDENGAPKVFYHGTRSEPFNTFGDEHQPYRGGLVAFFSSNPKFANEYASNGNEAHSLRPNYKEGHVYPVHLKMTNPFDYKSPFAKEEAKEFYDNYMSTNDRNMFSLHRGGASDSRDAFVNSVANGEWPAIENEGFARYLKDSGYDGVVMNELGHDTFGVYDPSQIKSVFNQNPDSDNPRIDMEEGDKRFHIDNVIFPESHTAEIRLPAKGPRCPNKRCGAAMDRDTRENVYSPDSEYNYKCPTCGTTYEAGDRPLDNKPGKLVSRAIWNDYDGKMEIFNVEVSSPFRRKGAATAMYDAIEKYTGKQLNPSGPRSQEAKAFWVDRLNKRGVSLAEQDSLFPKEWSEPLPSGSGSDRTAITEWHDLSHPITKNRDGSPIDLYHGTEVRPFDKFDVSKAGYFTSTAVQGIPEKQAIWMSNDKESANYFGPRVMRCHVRMRNPLIVTPEERASGGKYRTANNYGLGPTELVSIAKEKGHDGLVMLDSLDGMGPASNVYASWNPENVWIRNQHVRLAEDMAETDSRISLEEPPAFYSRLRRLIESRMANRANPEEVQRLIANGGVSQEEYEYSGIKQLLESATAEGRPVTKQELLNAYSGNELNPSEEGHANVERYKDNGYVTKGGDDYGGTLFRLNVGNPSKPIQWTPDGNGGYSSPEGHLVTPVDNGRMWQAYGKQVLQNPYYHGFNSATSVGLLTPDLAKASVQKWEDELHNPAIFRHSHWGNVSNVLAHARHALYDAGKTFHVDEIQSDWHQKGRDNGYLGPVDHHKINEEMIKAGRDLGELWNTYAHFPVDDYESFLFKNKRGGSVWSGNPLRAVDADDYGIDRDSLINEWERRYPGIKAKIEEASNLRRLIDETEAKYKDAREKLTGDNSSNGPAPDAPYKKNWHELVFRKMLDRAVRQGADRITWTTGDQQNRRYGLDKVLSKIELMPLSLTDRGVRSNRIDQVGVDALLQKHPTLHGLLPNDHLPHGGYHLIGYDKNGRVVVSQRMEDHNALVAHVGKEMADKLLSSPQVPGMNNMGGPGMPHIIEGNNLRAGGSGMREFYDQIIPRFANKIGKRFGVQVQPYKLQIGISQKRVDTDPLLKGAQQVNVLKHPAGHLLVHILRRRGMRDSEGLRFGDIDELLPVFHPSRREDIRKEYDEWSKDNPTGRFRIREQLWKPTPEASGVKYTKVHSLPITDEMKQHILNNGQILMSEGGERLDLAEVGTSSNYPEPGTDEWRQVMNSVSYDPEAWKTPADQYVYGQVYKGDEDFTPEFSDKYLHDPVASAKRKIWKQSIRGALSAGLVDHDQAHKLAGEVGKGWVAPDSGEWQDIPTGTVLYHATPDIETLMQQGLLHDKAGRLYDNQMMEGIGGGDKNSTSWTTDIGYAKNIAKFFEIARKLKNGEFNFHDAATSLLNGNTDPALHHKLFSAAIQTIASCGTNDNDVFCRAMHLNQEPDTKDYIGKSWLPESPEQEQTRIAKRIVSLDKLKDQFLHGATWFTQEHGGIESVAPWGDMDRFKGASPGIVQTTSRPGVRGTMFPAEREIRTYHPDAVNPIQRLSDPIELTEKDDWHRGSDRFTKNLDGSPATFYHGTRSLFNAFDKTKRGAVFFTKDPKTADVFATTAHGDKKHPSRTLDGSGAAVYPVHVKSTRLWDYENPRHVDMIKPALARIAKLPSSHEFYPDFAFDGSDENLLRRFANSGDWSVIEHPYVMGLIKKLGFDAFTVREMSKNIGVFDPRNVKSIFNQNPTTSKRIDMNESNKSQLSLPLGSVHEKSGTDASGRLQGANSDISGLVKDVVAGSNNPESRIHGEHHWQWVAHRASKIASLNGGDPKVGYLFGLFHDTKRDNDSHDPDHGDRAAEYIDEFRQRLPLDDDQINKLKEACRVHTNGGPIDDPTIGACQDADRLHLTRVGYRPDPKYFSTDVGKGMIPSAWDDEEDEHPWDETWSNIGEHVALSDFEDNVEPGKPLHLFHGSPQELNLDSIEPRYPNYSGSLGEGMYFAFHPREATRYGKNIVHAIGAFKNPLHIDPENYDTTRVYSSDEPEKDYQKKWVEPYQNILPGENMLPFDYKVNGKWHPVRDSWDLRQLGDNARDAGHDAVFFTRMRNTGDEALVFDKSGLSEPNEVQMADPGAPPKIPTAGGEKGLNGISSPGESSMEHPVSGPATGSPTPLMKPKPMKPVG